MFAEWAGLLGWRSPARATALAQLSAGVVGDPSAWTARPASSRKSLDAILAERPASVQDRWFARLYWLKPVAIVALAAFWIVTGVIALGPGRAAGMSYLTKAGLGASAAEFWLVAGSLFDIAIGLRRAGAAFRAARAATHADRVGGLSADRNDQRRRRSGPIRSGPTPRSSRC